MFGDVCRSCTKSHTIASNLSVALSANYEEGHTDRFRASLWQCRWWFAIGISLRLCTPRRPHGSMSVWLTFISSTFHWLIFGRFKDFFKCCAKKTFVPGFAKLLRCVQLVGDKPTTPRVIWLLLARKGTVMSMMSRSRPQIPASRPHGLTASHHSVDSDGVVAQVHCLRQEWYNLWEPLRHLKKMHGVSILKDCAELSAKPCRRLLGLWLPKMARTSNMSNMMWQFGGGPWHHGLTLTSCWRWELDCRYCRPAVTPRCPAPLLCSQSSTWHHSSLNRMFGMKAAY